MTPVNFKESNFTFMPPDSEAGESITQPLPVYRGQLTDGKNIVVSCWELSEDELKEVARTGKVWLYVYFRCPPPVFVGTESPFTEIETK